jgi:hypothetical protein
MARVTGKYDVDFERGEGGFSSVFGTYIGTRLKEGKEQYARELKAADPTNEYEILKDLMEERRRLVSDMSRLRASPTGGGSVSVSSTDPGMKDAADFVDRVEERNREDGSKFQLGGELAGALDVDIERTLSQDSSPEAKASEIAALFVNNRPTSMRDESQAHGFAMGISNRVAEAVKNNEIDKDTGEAIRLELRKRSGIQEYDEDRYEDPTLLTPGQKERLPWYLQASTRTTSVRKQMGEGIDPSELAGFYNKRLQELDEMIVDQQSAYRTASNEYKQLAKGPNRNLALAPVASRPSRLSETLDLYADVVEADPERGEAILQESRDRRNLNPLSPGVRIPDRFEGLKSVAGSGGKAPIDVLLDSSDTLAMLRGKTGTTDAVERDLKPDDVELVRGSLDRMLKTVQSPLYKGQKYGQIEQGKGNMLEIEEYLTGAIEFLDEVPDKDKPKLAQELSDELIKWRTSQNDNQIKSARAQGQPGYAVARVIGEVRSAKKNYDKTGNPEPLFEVMSKGRQTIGSTYNEVRGGVGDSLMGILDDAAKGSLSDANIQMLDRDLSDLENVSNEIGATGSGMLERS